MAVNERIGRIILEATNKGLVYDPQRHVYEWKLSHISQEQFDTIRDIAISSGERITEDDINVFMGAIDPPHFVTRSYTYSLPVYKVFPGEVVQMTWLLAERAVVEVELICMKCYEFMVVCSSSSQLLPVGKLCRFFNDTEFAVNHSLYIDSISSCRITKTATISPSLAVHYLALYCQQDLYKYQVTDNIWSSYGSLRDYINNGCKGKLSDLLFHSFTIHGLSMFVFLKMLQVLNDENSRRNSNRTSEMGS